MSPDDFETIKLSLAIISLSVALIGCVYFSIKRDHPVLFYRCSIVNIVSIGALAVDQLISAFPYSIRSNSSSELQNYLIVLFGMTYIYITQTPA